MSLNIGVVRDTYAEKRLIIDLIPENKYIKIDSLVPNSFDLLTYNEKQWSSWVNKTENIDIVHFFNSVNYGDAPWIVTFETNVPRLYGADHLKMGMETLLKDNCIGIIAMSRAALNIHRNAIKRSFPDYLSILDKKTHIIHPPQTLVDSDMYRYNSIKPLKLIFVSNQFFLKGGLAMLEALIEFRKEWPVELTLVTRYQLNDNVTMNTEEDVSRVKKIVEQNSDWIVYYNGAPNEKVLTLMGESHLGIMMSFAETYGYVALELQATGTPVVTTNIRAFPEINNNEVGWLIDYPYPNGRLPSGTSRDDVLLITENMKKQLLDVLREIVQNNGVELAKKAFKCKNKIFEDNNPNIVKQRLKYLYSLIK